MNPEGIPQRASGLSRGPAARSAFDRHTVIDERLDPTLQETAHELGQLQKPDGHWLFELEADATIPAEYVMMRHFLGDAEPEQDRRIARYLRQIQDPETGGWPLFPGGAPDLSATVKAYFALKLAGHSADEPHMLRAREAVLAQGGAARANVFTRFALALFGQVPWRAVPTMPVEMMLLPERAPFHLSKVSYWSRTVIAPLLILAALKPVARNPNGVHVRELFLRPPEEETDYIHNPTGRWLGDVFVMLDRVLKRVEPRLPHTSRRRAIRAALDFIRPRLNGEDGLGGIFPAMANVVMAFDALGMPADDPDMMTARRAVDKLLAERGDALYCQPCLSPVWDTVLAAHAMMEAGEDPGSPAIARACRWLVEREVQDVKGDWAAVRPDVEPSGWAFQFRNDYYPDLDDTAVAVMLLHRSDPERHAPVIRRAVEWILGLQSRNGGWGAFDADNTHDHLNHIPFADHGALLDPPTADVTARCLGMLGQLGYPREHPAIQGALEFLEREQEPDGSWFGRWGANYVYGTWSVLSAFRAVGESEDSPHILRAVEWLKSRQNADGGWGESLESYWQSRRDVPCESTPSQTAWALLGLMAAGRVDSVAVARGIEYLLDAEREGPRWREELWTGTGFPRVFYLKYHGYAAYFPIWALARYRNLKQSNTRSIGTGL